MSEFAEHTPLRPPAIDELPTAPAVPLSEYYEQKLLKKAERKSKRRASIPLKFTAAALVINALSTGYQSDVSANEKRAMESQPLLHTVSQEYLGESPSSVFYLAGFDTQNADVFAEKVGVTIHQVISGSDISVDYGDAPLEPEEIAKKIIEATEENKLKTISIVGNSLGGLVSAKVAEYIILNTDIEVEAIGFYATPDGSAGLLPATKSDLATMIDVLGVFDDRVKYSSFARYAMTLSQETYRFTHEDTPLDAFIAAKETSDDVIEQIQERRRPGMWLVVDQALAVTRISLKETLANIGEQRGEKRMPVLVVMRTTDASDDNVVDVNASARNTCDYAYDADLNCTIVYVKDAQHTSFIFDTEQFNAGMAPHVESLKEEIQEEAQEYEYDRLEEWRASLAINRQEDESDIIINSDGQTKDDTSDDK